MSILARRTPFQDLVALRNEQIRPQDRRSLPAYRDQSTVLPINMYQTEDAYVIVAAVPGVDDNDIEIKVTDGELVIQVKSQATDEISTRNYVHRERRFGRRTRAITLPKGIQPDDVKASFDRGLLTCTIPKPEKVRPIRVNVK